MIGWRPVLLTLLAAGMLGLAVLHAQEVEPAPPPPPCDAAKTLRASGMLAQARAAYVGLLSAGEQDECVKTGLDAVTRAQCERAGRLATASLEEAMKAYVAIAIAEPVRGAVVCAREGMARVAMGADE